MESRDSLTVYAVVRFDRFLGTRAPLEEMLTVKEILPSVEDAEEEVRRLNELVKDEGVIYFCQATRWFPGGRQIPTSANQ